MSWLRSVLASIEKLTRPKGLNEIYDIEASDIAKIDVALGRPPRTALRKTKERETMRTIEETIAKAREASTRVDSLIALSNSQKARVEELLAAQGTIPPHIQEGLDAIFNIDESDAGKIDAALNANVPPADVDPANDPNVNT